MMRADEILVLRGLAPSRSKARARIEEGKVSYLSKVVDKPSRALPDDAVPVVAAGSQALRYVSRAGLKLEAFLEKFCIDVSGANALDAGASTGGFTDCLLSRGAAWCACVDVGSGQLAEKLLSDKRVRNMEKTDVRSLNLSIFGGKKFDFICADLSFISLSKAIPSLMPLLGEGAAIVCLVKPQFESSACVIKKCGGVLKDGELRMRALRKIEDFFAQNYPSAEKIGSMDSPIAGGDGNVEFLIGYRNRTSNARINAL